MTHLYGIADCIDIRNRRFHPLIDRNASLDSQFQAGVFGQVCIRCNADGQYHYISVKRRFLFQ